MMTPHRRQFLQSAVGMATLAIPAVSLKAQEKKADAPQITWHDASKWGVEGRGWSETERYYDRLPAKAKAKVRDAVWSLSRHSAGMLVRFETNARAIHVRYKLLSSRLEMPHMPATGVSGVDLYARNGQGQDRWLDVAMPTSQNPTVVLGNGVDALPNKADRLFTLYLPLYNGVDSLEIGVAADAHFQPVKPREENPLVFYGTSIMHGACASRPGLAIPAILGRRFQKPTINLGFSGNGRMEAEVGALLGELDPSLYIIDCLPNMGGAEVAQRAVPLVQQLRKARPETPILLVEDRSFTGAAFREGQRKHHETSRKALKQAFQKLQDEGVKRLGYLEGEDLLGDDGEGATDGSHPNDLGMIRYADAYEKAIRKLLNS